MLRVVQPHPDLDGVSLPDEVEDVLHDGPGSWAVCDQVSGDVFYDVMLGPALPRCAQHSSAQTGQPWILSTFCSQSRHCSGRSISVLSVTRINSSQIMLWKCLNVTLTRWQSLEHSLLQIGVLFVNIYPGRLCHYPLSLFCYWAPTRLNSKHTEQTDVWADWLHTRDPTRPVSALSEKVRGARCCLLPDVPG